MRSLSISLGLYHVYDFGLARIKAPLVEDQAGKLIKESFSQPFKFELPRRFLALLSWGLVLESNGPELFGYEILDLLVPVNDEAECGKLAGSIADYVVVLAIRAKEDLSKVKRL